MMLVSNKQVIGITGATGVLGTIVCEVLRRNGMEVSAFTGDLRNKVDVKNWFSLNSLSCIIHLAALVPTTSVSENPLKAYSTNVGGTINLLEELCCSNSKVWIFYASTSHVYASSNEPLKEESQKNPVSLYGKTKLMGEEILLDVASLSSSNISCCIGRIFSYYHHTQKPPFLYPNLIKRIENEDLSKDFELYGAESVRDFLEAEDLANLIYRIIQRKPEGVYNIASGRGIKIKEFAQRLTDIKLKIIPKGTPDFLVADITKLTNYLEQSE